MSTIINATTTNGVVIQPDNSGSLVLQTNSGTTALTIDTSQRAAFVAGTAALPAITTTGDTNTGIWFPAADTIAFAEGGAESMRIDSSGNVGIGTSSPTAKLHVAGNITVNDGQQYCFGSNNYNGMAGSAASNIVQFYTNNTERMRIDSSGNVLVGTTSQVASGLICAVGDAAAVNPITIKNTGSAAASNRYFAYFINSSNAMAGGIAHTASTTTAYTTSSDYRLKENIVPMIGALDKVALLKPVTYTWKSDGLDGQGFIAHELQAVVPDAVVGEKDAVDSEGNIQPQSVDTSFLVATLTAAIQEQQTIINDLKARIETLEGAK